MESKVVVITGASEGIGAELARQLGRENYRLVLAARRKDVLEKVAAECGPHCVVVTANVRDRDQVERLRDEALSAFGRIDVWVNNAGRGINRNAVDVTDEDLDEMMSVNVKSALYGIQAVLPHFTARGSGHIINISSFLARVPAATFRSAYSAAKAALNSLTANIRMELAKSHPGIYVSLIMPGMVTTDFAKNVLGEPRPPLPPGGAVKPQTPEEVAAVIVRVIQEPVSELFTNPMHAEISAKYFHDVAAFECDMG